MKIPIYNFSYTEHHIAKECDKKQSSIRTICIMEEHDNNNHLLFLVALCLDDK